MSLPQPFPEDVLEDIRTYSGNQKCCDCPSLDTDWASVSHGTLICLDCAGKHRSLGVHVSFVRSITMDTWSIQQIEMMKQGGNSQIRRFFKKIGIDNTPIQTLYCTKAAEHYREKLKERVDKISSGEIVLERKVSSERLTKRTMSSDSAGTSKGSTVQHHVITAKFGPGPMGMTLTKDYRDHAIVSRLVPGGPAQQQGVKVGDIAIGIAGKTLGSYDEIMHMIPLMPRPLDVRFSREKSDKEQSPRNDSGSSSGAPVSGIMLSRSDPALFGMDSSRFPAAQQLLRNTDSPDLTFPASTGSTHNSSSSNLLSGIKGTRAVDLNSIADTQKQLPPKPTNKASGPSKTSSSHPMSNAKVAKVRPLRGSKSRGIDVAADDEDDDDDSDDGNRVDLDDDEEDENNEDEEDEEDEEASDEANKASQGEGTATRDVDCVVEEELPITTEKSSPVDSTNDKSDRASTPSSSSSPRTVLDVGSVVKVLRDSGKWKTAMIKRRHKNNSFKVIYKDGSDESYVTLDRLALPQSALPPELQQQQKLQQKQLQQFMASPANASTASADAVVRSAYDEAMQSALRAYDEDERQTATGSSSSRQTALDFKVESDVNLDDWIERDFTEDLDYTAIKADDSYFAPKASVDEDLYLHVSAKAPGSTGGEGFHGGSVQAPDLVVQFLAPPLGLTLSANARQEAEVIRLKENGSAVSEGVQVGDIVVQIDGRVVCDYEDAMAIISTSLSYPTTIAFRRPVKGLVAEAFVRNSKLLAERFMDSMGLNKSSSILSTKATSRLANSNHKSAGSSSASASTSSTTNHNSSSYSSSASSYSSNNNHSSHSRHSGRLDPNPTAGQFDVRFDADELGFRVEEKIGVSSSTIVTDVAEKGEARAKGVTIGCVIVGINYEAYLSHAHTVATLKYSKKPVVIRFQK